MTSREHWRDLATMAAIYVIVVAALFLAGPVAALIAFILGGSLICLLAIAWRALCRTLDEADELLGAVDREHDDELRARRALRIQHTVQAEVIPLHGRRPKDGAA